MILFSGTFRESQSQGMVEEEAESFTVLKFY